MKSRSIARSRRPLVCLLVGERRSEGRHARRREGLHDADRPDHHLSRHVRQSLPQAGRACRRPRHLGRRHDRRRRQDRPRELCRARSPGRGPAGRLPALSHGQPLLRDRQAEPDGLGSVRQHPAAAGGACRRYAISSISTSSSTISRRARREPRSTPSRSGSASAAISRISPLRFCRCLNIPARYVNGHLGDIGVPVVDPMDFSAWIEVFLEGSWWTFDPRNNMPRIGRIVVARGRDAADIPLINSFGPHALKSFRVWTYEVAEQPAMAPERLTRARSSARADLDHARRAPHRAGRETEAVGSGRGRRER